MKRTPAALLALLLAFPPAASAHTARKIGTIFIADWTVYGSAVEGEFHMYNNMERRRRISCRFAVVDNEGSIVRSKRLTRELAKRSREPRNHASTTFDWTFPPGEYSLEVLHCHVKALL